MRLPDSVHGATSPSPATFTPSHGMQDTGQERARSEPHVHLLAEAAPSDPTTSTCVDTLPDLLALKELETSVGRAGLRRACVPLAE